MADPRDDRVSSAYREMPGEGPSPALDAAIQAAARRAVGSRPGGARRWQIPVSIAAVLALAIGISLNVDREKPLVVDGTPVSSGSAEYPVSQAAPEKDELPAPVQAPKEPEAPRAREKQAAALPEAKRFTPDPPRAEPAAAALLPAPAPAAAPAPASPPAPAPMNAQMPAPASAPAAASPAPAPPAVAGAAASSDAARAAPQAAKRAKAELAREATIQERTMSEALDTPERRLERIADLRAKGLHDEADRALAELRRAYPAYRISEDWLRKVERR